MLNWLKSRIDSLRGTVVNALALVSEHLAGQLWLIEAKFLPLAKDAYSKNEVVYACVNLLASSVPEPPLVAYQKTRGTEEKQALSYDHPLMALIKSPNELQTEYEFWELTTICMAIIGRAFWWKRRDNAGRIIALWPLRPDRVGPIYSDSDAPSEQVLFGWSYQQPGTGRVVPIPRRDMLAFNFPDPAGESGGIVEGLGPVQALARQIASDNEATRYVGALLANYAIPGVAVKLKREVRNEAEAQAVKAHFRAEFGGANRGTPALLDAETDLTEIGFNLKELEFPELREVSESRISGALGVPAVLAGLRIGLKESNNRASLAELREYFAETTLSNYWRRYSDQFTNDIASEFGQGLVCEFDTGRVKALAGQRQQQIAPIVDGFKNGGVLLNEYRAALHLPPLEGGDVRLIPSTVIEVLGMTQEAVKASVLLEAVQVLQAAQLQRPAVKHLPGQHDQAAHAHKEWAGSECKNVKQVRAVVKTYDQWTIKDTTNEEAQALTDYKAFDYKRINTSLRRGGEPPEMEALDSALQKAPLIPQDILLFRGAGTGKAFKGLAPGTTIQDTAYISATFDRKLAKQFGHTVEIKVSAGSKGAFIDGFGSNEWEMLLPRNAQFTVVSNSASKTVLEYR